MSLSSEIIFSIGFEAPGQGELLAVTNENPAPRSGVVESGKEGEGEGKSQKAGLAPEDSTKARSWRRTTG